ncbi:hypothetical protein FRC06_006916, partial [Ceratobasidium sp. 370]
RTLTDVLDICYRISRHPKARHYTLQQFNCFFLSWNIILGLLRSEAGWEAAIVHQHEVIHRAVDGWLQEFAATEGTSNLALVISDTAIVLDPAEPSLGSHSSLTYAVSDTFRSQSAVEKLRAAFHSVLWATEQEGAITSAVRRILLETADETAHLVYDGTGETSLDKLFEREEPLDVPPEWKPDIQTEGARLVGEFVNSLIWTHFGAALNHSDHTATRDKTRSKLSLAQRARYSEPVLMVRLSLLGCKTAWRNTNAIASVGPYGEKHNSLARMTRVLQHAPRQIKNVVQISRPFLSVVGAKLEKSVAAGERIEIKGIGDNILDLAPDLDVDQAKLEDQVISQIEWSIGNLAKAHDGYDKGTLRMATLQLLAHLRNKGRELCFVVDPIQLWQMCLWYGFADGMINSVAKIAGGLCTGSEPKYQCRQAVTSSSQRHVILKRELTYSKIEVFIRGRIRHLSETAKKDTLRLAEPCQRELERAMSEIWNDRQQTTRMDIPATPMPPGRFTFRSILRDANTPRTGQSVRWDARNAFRTITPNTSAGSATEGAPSVEDIPRTPLLEDEEHTSFLDRLHSDSSEGRSGANRIDELAALGQSVGSRLTAAPAISTTPPTPGPAPPPKSLAPIPRPRFNSTTPSTSSPLARDDSTLSLPNSMSPAPDFSLSHKPFDMSRELDAIPIALGNESSGMASDASVVGVRNGSRGHQPSVITLGDIDEDATRFYSGNTSSPPLEGISPGNGSTREDTVGPGISVRGMTTRYPPGMFNLTKSQARLSAFSVEPDTSGERSQPSMRPKRRDTTGSSSLDFITASGGGSARSSLPPAPMPDFDPPPVPTTSGSVRSSLPARVQSSSSPLSRSNSYSNLLSRATTTAPSRELLANTLPHEPTARELPTLYPPGHMRFDQTTIVPQVDPDNIPELTRFFTPTLGEGDVWMTRTTMGHHPSGQSQSSFAPETDREPFSPDATGVPLPVSPPLTISTSSSRPPSASSSQTSVADLTNLIESQYKADLAAHAALVPILLARAESAEGSAKRLAGVVKDTRGRVRELEMLCVELGEEVGILREERAGLASERIELVSQVNDLSTERDVLLGEVGNPSTDVAGMTRVQQDRDVLDAASGQALREMHATLRRAE